MPRRSPSKPHTPAQRIVLRRMDRRCPIGRSGFGLLGDAKVESNREKRAHHASVTRTILIENFRNRASSRGRTIKCARSATPNAITSADALIQKYRYSSHRNRSRSKLEKWCACQLAAPRTRAAWTTCHSATDARARVRPSWSVIPSSFSACRR